MGIGLTCFRCLTGLLTALKTLRGFIAGEQRKDMAVSGLSSSEIVLRASQPRAGQLAVGVIQGQWGQKLVVLKAALKDTPQRIGAPDLRCLGLLG